jgi:GH15 family glucan-1,4-alpha-glucosidase
VGPLKSQATNLTKAAALCFFISPADPRFISTMKQILKTPEKGGLTANSLVFRYDVNKAEDGVGGQEGAFTMCTWVCAGFTFRKLTRDSLWAIEALSRCGQYGGEGDGQQMIKQAVRMFEEVGCTLMRSIWLTKSKLLSYGNHVQLYAEEISSSGEALGNVPQAFCHTSAISTAFNLNRILDGMKVGTD